MSTATPFVFFAAMTAVQFIVVVAAFYPETKGQTLEELQRKLMRLRVSKTDEKARRAAGLMQSRRNRLQGETSSSNRLDGMDALGNFAP